MGGNKYEKKNRQRLLMENFTATGPRITRRGEEQLGQFTLMMAPESNTSAWNVICERAMDLTISVMFGNDGH